MRAWQVQELGEPLAVLREADLAVPEAGPGQVVVRTLATAANFPDVLMCRGLYQVKPDLPFTPGVELCGEITALGEGVEGFAVGDRVLGGAALPAGGVGSAAIQLGKAAGAKVIGVVGGADKAEVARALGADVVVDRHTQDFVEVVKAETGGRGADVIYDPVGGENYKRSTKCIAFEGRILIVGFAGGTIQEAALNHALIKNYSIVGLHWGLYNAFDPEAVQQCHRELTALADKGLVNPLVSERLSFDEVPDGLQRLADGTTVGRVVYQAAR